MAIRFIYLIILCLLPNICWSDSYIEHTLGPFDLTKNITETQLVSEFGSGYVINHIVDGKTMGRSHVYYVPAVNAWLEVQLSHTSNNDRLVDTIILTRKKLCDEKHIPVEDLTKLITGRGVGIGSSLKKVINTYGKSDVSISLAKQKAFSNLQQYLKLSSGLVLRYLYEGSESNLYSEFYIKNGKLHSLLISVSE